VREQVECRRLLQMERVREQVECRRLLQTARRVNSKEVFFFANVPCSTYFIKRK
jgi:hypothetical protein